MCELETDTDILRFRDLEILLNDRKTSLGFLRNYYISITGEGRDRLKTLLCREYDRLVVAAAQKIVDTYNPDGTPKERKDSDDN